MIVGVGRSHVGSERWGDNEVGVGGRISDIMHVVDG